MPEKQPTWEQIQQDRDKLAKLPLDPEEAMRALMETGPHPDSDESPDKKDSVGRLKN